jgi:phosphoglycolate phosphatase-like HAD superfamily hydrolase
MQMARSAGAARLAVGHGAHEACDLLEHAPLACVRDCEELRAWLADHG